MAGRIAAIIAIEACPQLKAPTNIAGEDEGRLVGQVAGVGDGLDKGSFHCLLVGRGTAFGGALAAAIAALFGFNQKAVGFVEIDVARGDFAAGVVDADVFVEAVGVVGDVALWRRAIHTEGIAKVYEEGLVVGSFVALAVLPGGEEGFNPRAIAVVHKRYSLVLPLGIVLYCVGWSGRWVG